MFHGGVSRTLAKLPDIFATPRERLENQEIRNRILAQQQARADSQRQREAEEQLSGLLSTGKPLDQNQAIGLLSTIDPDLVAKGVAGQIFPGQERAETALVRNLRAAGVDPESEEGREIILANVKNRGGTEELLRRVDLELRLAQLAGLREERETATTTATKERGSLIQTIQTTLNNAERLENLNSELEGTFVESGIPFPQLRRDLLSGAVALGKLFGGNVDTQNRAIEDFDTFNKLSKDFIFKAIGNLKGRITDTRFDALVRTLPDIGTSPGANRRIMADIIEATLDLTDINNIDIPNRERFEALIENLRNPGFRQKKNERKSPPRRRRLRFNPKTGKLESL